MKISVFGLGYVGCVSAACLTESGHEVIGVDVNPTKVKPLQEGRSPIIEKELDALIKKGADSGRLTATSDGATALANSDVSLICVGTPSRSNDSLNLDYIDKVSEEIGRALRGRKTPHVVCVRSTMLPGSCSEHVIPALKKGYGGDLPDHLTVAVNPEFLREGSAVFDYFNPPKTVVGADSEAALDTVCALYTDITAPMIRTSIRTAEMVKYTDNVFHALKISFANEIGTLCKSFDIDSHEVMDIFCSDQKLNISRAYLKPGFAFGGSCLPKDVRALVHRGRTRDLNLPLLSAILPSNNMQIDRAIDMIAETGKKKLSFLGLSFKPGTDDLRESPLVILIETFIGKGYDIRIYDENVSLARLVGANKAYIEREIPHISSLMVTSLQEATDFADVLIVGHNSDEFRKGVDGAKGKKIFDLARIYEDVPASEDYLGFNW